MKNRVKVEQRSYIDHLIEQAQDSRKELRRLKSLTVDFVRKLEEAETSLKVWRDGYGHKKKDNYLVKRERDIEAAKIALEQHKTDIEEQENEIQNIETEIEKVSNAQDKNMFSEAQRQRDHEEKMAKIELMKLEQQRLTAEAARDAAALAKAHENEQFANILKSLKNDES